LDEVTEMIKKEVILASKVNQMRKDEIVKNLKETHGKPGPYYHPEIFDMKAHRNRFTFMVSQLRRMKNID